MKNEYKEVEPVFKRSRQLVPFCPYCGKELDELSLINYSDTCDCGEWTQNYNHKYLYKRLKQIDDSRK